MKARHSGRSAAAASATNRRCRSRRRPSPHARRCRAPCGREQSRSGRRPSRTEVEVARVADPGGFVPMFSTTLGRSGIVTPPSTLLLGDRGVGSQRLVLVVRRPATRAVGWRARGASRGIPPGRRPTTRSPASIRACSRDSARVFAAALEGSHDRFGAPAVHHRQRNQDRVSELRFRESLVQTVAAVKQAYWTLKATLANVTVQQRSLELAEGARASEPDPRRRRDIGRRSISCRRKPKSHSAART